MPDFNDRKLQYFHTKNETLLQEIKEDLGEGEEALMFMSW